MTERQTVNDFLQASRSRIERLDPSAALVAAAAGALVIDTRCAINRLSTVV